MTKMADDDPVELVRLTLTSHRLTMSLDEFDAVVKGSIVSDGKYKSWWDATKKNCVVTAVS